jgi:hypothetical protein
VGRLARGSANKVRKALSAAKIKALGDMKSLCEWPDFNRAFQTVSTGPFQTPHQSLACIQAMLSENLVNC